MSVQDDSRQETINAILRRISDLNENSLTQLSQYISYLKWQEELWTNMLEQELTVGDEQEVLWTYDFLEEFPSSRHVATRDPQMMEVKVALASCGMIQQRSLWQHPPVNGSAVCEYEVQIPATINALRLRFAVGIRDGAQMEGDNLCAFRIYVNGARLWSTTKQTTTWERFVLDLPSLSGQQAIVQFMTDSLGNNRWNWAVWGEPSLIGFGPSTD